MSQSKSERKDKNESAMEDPLQHSPSACTKVILPIRDALDILSGKWKLQIIGALRFSKSIRFKQLSREIPGITDKMLSKELKELEMNLLIKRTVYDAYPPVVEYSITEHGRSLGKVLTELAKWGTQHRKKIMGHS